MCFSFIACACSAEKSEVPHHDDACAGNQALATADGIGQSRRELCLGVAETAVAQVVINIIFVDRNVVGAVEPSRYVASASGHGLSPRG